MNSLANFEKNLPSWVASLRPSIRAKIFDVEVDDEVDLSCDIEINGIKCKKEHLVENPLIKILLYVRYQSPVWSSDPEFQKVSHELVILYWDVDTRLLFINSSIQNEGHFTSIAQSVVSGAKPKPVPMHKLQRIFNNATDARFVNVGMRNGAVGNSSEAYRMLTGPNAHLAVTRTDARTHIKGHAFAQGTFEEGITSLGFTDSGKIWSQNKSLDVLELIKQFGSLATKIQGIGTFMSNSELDALSPGEDLTEIPDDIIAVSWHERIYQRNFTIHQKHLADWDLAVDRASNDTEQIIVILSHDNASYRIVYKVTPPHFMESNNDTIELDDKRNLIGILNEYPLKLYTAKQSLIMGAQIFLLQSNLPPIDPSKFYVKDWTGIDIQREYDPQEWIAAGTIHSYILDQLCQTSPDIVFYDHDAGEIADFIAIYRDVEKVKIVLYHAKKAAKKNPGRDITQLYDVAGQAVKSVRWLKQQFLFERLIERFNQKRERLCKGDLEQFSNALIENPLPVSFEVVIVQPGISQNSLMPNIDETRPVKELLAATEDYVRQIGYAPLYIWSST